MAGRKRQAPQNLYDEERSVVNNHMEMQMEYERENLKLDEDRQGQATWRR